MKVQHFFLSSCLLLSSFFCFSNEESLVSGAEGIKKTKKMNLEGERQEQK